jgi:cytochrome c
MLIRRAVLCLLGVLSPLAVCWAQPDQPGRNVPSYRSTYQSLLSPSGAVTAGLLIYQTRCQFCHATERGRNDAGPVLRGIFNASAGRAPGYTYSTGMRYSGKIWNAAQLDRFLADPGRDVQGTKMQVNGMPNEQDRRAVIAYLATLN